MMDIQNIINSYISLLIIQYANQPKARALIELFVGSLLADGIMFDVEQGYNLDTAVGVQLDIIGKYVGIDRLYTQQIFSGFFSFINYDEVASPPVTRIGFSDYTDFETKTGKWLNYDSVISGTYLLSDDIFRLAIRMRILQNNNNYSHKAIDEAVSVFLPARASSVGNMHMAYIVPVAYLNLAIIALQKGLFSVPMGVLLEGVVIQTAAKMFGFATYNDTASTYITGFSNYSDYDTKIGETINYSKILN